MITINNSKTSKETKKHCQLHDYLESIHSKAKFTPHLQHETWMRIDSAATFDILLNDG